MTATRHAYGEGPDQYVEVYWPSGRPKPETVVIIHGGFWLSAFDATLGQPLAADLAERGWTAVNLEYRPSSRGGWPGTLVDVAAGIDALAGLDVDTTNVIAVGHSAGGQLAVWAAARPVLPASAPGAGPAVALRAAISQAGLLDLATAARDEVGGRAVPKLLGGLPDEYPERYALADPTALGTPPVPVACIHSRADIRVPFAQSSAYVAAAGGMARLVEVEGDHFAHIDPKSAAWAEVVRLLTTGIAS